ncbi:hypothetical protein ABMB67_004450 [Halalkalibacter oceani]
MKKSHYQRNGSVFCLRRESTKKQRSVQAPFILCFLRVLLREGKGDELWIKIKSG